VRARARNFSTRPFFGRNLSRRTPGPNPPGGGKCFSPGLSLQGTRVWTEAGLRSTGHARPAGYSRNGGKKDYEEVAGARSVSPGIGEAGGGRSLDGFVVGSSRIERIRDFSGPLQTAVRVPARSKKIKCQSFPRRIWGTRLVRPFRGPCLNARGIYQKALADLNDGNSVRAFVRRARSGYGGYHDTLSSVTWQQPRVGVFVVFSLWYKAANNTRFLTPRLNNTPPITATNSWASYRSKMKFARVPGGES